MGKGAFGMITIEEVARKAGVSKATVSRVINHSGYVGEKTRARVEAVIRQTGYTPSASAVNLSRQATSTIGVVIPEMGNAFFGELLHGIAEETGRADLTLLYFDTDNDPEKEARALTLLAQHRVRGLLITPARDADPAYGRQLGEQIEKLHVPTVLMDRSFPSSRWDGVFFENYQSGYCAGEALLQAGNRRLGIITGDLRLQIARDRYDGFCQAAKDGGYPVQERDVYQGDFTVEGGWRAACAMLDAPSRPQAVLTCNNLLTLGFLKAIGERGLHIGRDLALIGIDRIPELEYLQYGFSCVGRDTVGMGRLAVQMLRRRMEQPEAPRQISLVSGQLLLRGSEKRSGS